MAVGSNFMDEPQAGGSVGLERGVKTRDGQAKRPDHNLKFGPTAEDNGSLWDYAKLIGFRVRP